MTHVIHTEKYEHKCGRTFIVEVDYDYGAGAPQDESDCHGEVVTLDYNPHDQATIDYCCETYYDEGSIEELEFRARASLMRLLSGGRRRGENLYYDVWGSLEKAETVWGITDKAKAQEQVDRDFEYLRGWYDDEWQWVCVSVYATDEYGEKDEDYAHHCGGYESTIIEPEQRAWFVEVIEDLICQVEHDIRKALHKDQMELELGFA